MGPRAVAGVGANGAGVVVCPRLEVRASREVCRMHYAHLWFFPWPKTVGARVS